LEIGKKWKGNKMSKVTKIQMEIDIKDRYRLCGVHEDYIYISLTGKEVSYIQIEATRKILEDIADSIQWYYNFKDNEEREKAVDALMEIAGGDSND
jgi:hypothetical protein